MTFTLKPLRREQVKLRAALIGPPGSGKSIGALNIARAIGGNWAAIDTEDKLKLYGDRFPEVSYDVLEDTSPEGYIEAMRTCVASGADGVLIDSLSHEWLSILEEADKFSNWKDLTPRHKAMLEMLTRLPVHVVVTMRSKIKYDVSERIVDGRKKQVIERLGPGPVQREGIEYEMDIVGYLDETHRATFLNRCDALVGQTLPILADPPGSEPEAVPIILKWLEYGEPDPNMQRASDAKIAELRALLDSENIDPAVVEDQFHRQALRSGGVLTLGWVEEKIQAAHVRASGAPPAAAPELTPVPRTWAEVALGMTSAYGDGMLGDFAVFVEDAAHHLYSKPLSGVFSGRPETTLTRAELASLLAKAAGAYVNLREAVDRDFPPPTRVEVQAAFGSVLEGAVLDGPAWGMGPGEDDRPARPQEGLQEPAEATS